MNSTHSFSRIIKVSIIAIGLALATGTIYAQWSPPPFGTPPTCPLGTPGCNVPINVGNDTQIKDGNLVVNGGGSWATGLSVYGNVGIGTPLPAQKLHVVTGDINIDSGQGFRINNTATAGQYLRGDGTRFVSSAIQVGDLPSLAGLYIQNQTAVDQVAGFRINGNGLFNGGNVGIGTAVPGARLHVVGTTRFGDTWFPFTDGWNYLRGNTQFDGILYDENDPNYYLNPNSTSNVNALHRVYGFNAREYDINNLGYYIDLDQTSIFNNLYSNVFVYSSDESLKKDIRTIPNALEKILQLRGVGFSWKESGAQSVGVIAQEVEKVFPELVHANPATGLRGVEYGNLVGPLIEAVKELKNENDQLRARVELLEAKS